MAAACTPGQLSATQVLPEYHTCSCRAQLRVLLSLSNKDKDGLTFFGGTEKRAENVLTLIPPSGIL